LLDGAVQVSPTIPAVVMATSLATLEGAVGLVAEMKFNSAEGCVL